jgi:sulfur carrier protein
MTINGKPSSLSGLSLSECLRHLGLDSTRLAVELNGDIISSARYSDIFLQENDVVELIQFVGGG